MLPQTSGDRYVVYMPPAVNNHKRYDPHLTDQIDSEIGKFLTEWNVTTIFAKEPRPHVVQLKKDRQDMRAFASYWHREDLHVLLVLTIYKKRRERQHWDDLDDYEEFAAGFHDVLDARDEAGQLPEYLENLHDDDDYRLLGPETF